MPQFFFLRRLCYIWFRRNKLLPRHTFWTLTLTPPPACAFSLPFCGSVLAVPFDRCCPAVLFSPYGGDAPCLILPRITATTLAPSVSATVPPAATFLRSARTVPQHCIAPVRCQANTWFLRACNIIAACCAIVQDFAGSAPGNSCCAPAPDSSANTVIYCHAVYAAGATPAASQYAADVRTNKRNRFRRSSPTYYWVYFLYHRITYTWIFAYFLRATLFCTVGSTLCRYRHWLCATLHLTFCCIYRTLDIDKTDYTETPLTDIWITCYLYLPHPFHLVLPFCLPFIQTGQDFGDSCLPLAPALLCFLPGGVA